jgi:uncharacterized membrane protein YvbJ
MVDCPNCDAKNEEDDEYCSKCGEPLKKDDIRRSRWERRQRRRDECFGLPGGNIIGPLIAGIILILVGLSAIYGFQYLRYLGPALIVLIGLLIIAGAIYRTRRKN